MFCCEPISFDTKELEKIKETEPNRVGVCDSCGEETVDGEAVSGCYYSPCECKECGWKPCDGSC